MANRRKKTVTPVVMGIRPQREKKIIALHYHPEAIRTNVKELSEASAEDKNLHALFEDIQVLVNWALDRLSLATPPKENGAQTRPTENAPQTKRESTTQM